jgi:hypothetical protein
MCFIPYVLTPFLTLLFLLFQWYTKHTKILKQKYEQQQQLGIDLLCVRKRSRSEFKSKISFLKLNHQALIHGLIIISF